MPREKDPFRRYVTFLNGKNGKWRCNFCEQENGGGATRIKAHLAGIGGFGIKGCERVDVNVRANAKVALKANRVMDSSDRDVSEERIQGNAGAAPTSTSDPPHVDGGTNLQFPHGVPALTPETRGLMEEMVQEDMAIDIVNLPLDGATSYSSASPLPNSFFSDSPNELSPVFTESITLNAQKNPSAPLPSQNRQLLGNTFQNESQGSILPGLMASDAQLTNMPTTNIPQHFNQPDQTFHRHCGPPIIEPFNSPLQIPEDIMDTTGPSTLEGNSNLDCNRPRISSVSSVTNIVPHSNQPLPSCNEECGIETSSFPLRESMDIYPLTATHVDLQFPEGEANMGGPSSSQGASTCSTEALGEELSCLVALPHRPQYSLPSLHLEDMPMNDQQTPAGESSSQHGQLHAAGNSHCLQDRNQHSQLQTPVDIDRSIPSQHTIVDLQVPEVATDTTGPSSSQGFSNREHAELHCIVGILEQERILEDVRAAPTSTSDPPNVEGTTNLQFAQGDEGGRHRKPPFDGAMSYSPGLNSIMEQWNVNQQDVIVLNSGQQPQAEHQFHQSSTMPSQVQNSQGESISCSTMALAEADSYIVDTPYPPQFSIRSPYPKEMQMSDQQTPTGASSFQYDQSPAAGDSHIIEATMVISQAPEAATNTTVPSSSEDMNRSSPSMDVRSINANDEEIRNLKRKVEELNDKEADIKEQMEIESAASSVRKKPRILVERWLTETERARNNFQIIGQAHAGTLPPKEQVETLTREVEKLIERRLPQTLLIEERDAKGVKFLERKLTGETIHRNIELIWDRLKENHACKLGIYGMGGVGKTTIMMHIHNRLLEDATFDGVAFITVSQDFSIYKLQSDIWKELKFGVMEDEHEKKRATMLSEKLERKNNCVLILDDVWKRLDLQEVGIPIKAYGIKLVLTTRSFDVCHQMLCQEKIKIEPLSQKQAENLFLRELGSQAVLNLEIEAILKFIVRECAGLPLGVITMARSMRGVTDVFEWRDSLVKLKESSKVQTDMEENVLTILKFSYDRLGNPDDQQCFLSCAFYPEDKYIDKLELIEFFIDQGLIGGLSTRKEQHDRGLSILKKLANVCLLEDHETTMKMHDLIRDMALHIMSATSIVKAGKELMRIPSEEYWTDALEKVSLMQNRFREFPLDMSPNCPKLSTLLLDYGLSHDAVIPDSFFKKLWGLKVLNLSGYNMTELPNSISDLVNLRALSLRYCWKLRRIPYLGKLTSLRKLDASGCESLEEAPEGLGMLVNLRYLDLTRARIERLPKGTLDCLLNLQCLRVQAINEEDIAKLGVLETFRCYLKNADDFNKCVRVIEQSNKPRYYDLNNNVDRKVPEFIVEVSDDARFGNLARNVNIRDWGHAIVSVGGECTGNFILIPRDVQRIEMEDCDGVTNLFGMGLFKYLESLKIMDCKNLRVPCGGQDEEGIDIHGSPAVAPAPLLFQSLRVLEIIRCPKLKYLFGHGSKSNLPHLRKIEIYYCEEMVGIIAAVTSPPPHPLPFFPSLEEIVVGGCDKMKRAVESGWMPHFPNLRRIDVDECEKMEEIIGGPPSYVPVKEISLESIDLSDCPNMRKLLSHDWLLHLRNLQSIAVYKCKGMVEMISGAGQGQEGSIMTPVNNTPSSFQPPISLPKLKELYLNNLPQLKSICVVPISCDSMENLRVYKCPELKGIPLQLRLRDIEELPHILVEDEEKWKTLMWDHPDAQATLQPYLQKGEHTRTSAWEEWRPPNAIELNAKRKDLPVTLLSKKA